MDSTTIPIITIDGSYFYKGDERFIVRGVVYQNYRLMRRRRAKKGVPDSLDDEYYAEFAHDVELLKELHVNAIWIYQHDPNINHARCMNLLAENGIYAIFTLSSPTASINRMAPENSYDEKLLERFSAVIDSVARYRNTLGVCIASGVVNETNIEKDNIEEVWNVFGKVVRDLKQYMRFRSYDARQRVLPLCISDGEWASLNTSTFHYMADSIVSNRPPNGRVDFYCFCHYHGPEPWRPRSVRSRTARIAPDSEVVPRPVDLELESETQDESGARWAQRLPMEKFEKAEDPIPVLINEYGENHTDSRFFGEIAELYGTNMSSPLLNTLSGGFAYEFIEGPNRYGLVTHQSERTTKKLFDFFNFRTAMQVAIGNPQGATRNSTPAKPTRPIQLILDFDGTLTVKDTLSVVAGAGYYRQKQDNRRPPPRPWQDIVAAYAADYDAHATKYGRDGFMQKSLLSEMNWLESLSGVENASAQRVFDAGIFDHVTRQDVELAASDGLLSRDVELRPGWSRLLHFVHKLNDRTTPPKSSDSNSNGNGNINILSVNWSRVFIWNVLSKANTTQAPKHLRQKTRHVINTLSVFANELPSLDSPSSYPYGDSTTLRTAGDKLRKMRTFTHPSSSSSFTMTTTTTTETTDPQPQPQAQVARTVYIGDSPTDLPCLLTADVGICIVNSNTGAGTAQRPSTSQQDLQLTCEKLNIKLRPFEEFDPNQPGHGRSGKTIEEIDESMKTSPVTLYYAQDFDGVVDVFERVFV